MGLGCSDDNEMRRRMAHAAQLLRLSEHKIPLVWVGAPDEIDCYLELANQLFSEEEQCRMHSDQCSVTTECNIDHGLAVLAALRPDILQEGWYIESQNDNNLAVYDASGDASAAGLVFA